MGYIEEFKMHDKFEEAMEEERQMFIKSMLLEAPLVGRPNRTQRITKDDITNLRILLNTINDVEDFVTALD